MADIDDLFKPVGGNGWKTKEEVVLWRISECERRLSDVERSTHSGNRALGELRGRLITWAAVVAIVAGPIIGVATSWALNGQRDREVKTAIELLIHRLDREANKR